MIWKLYVFPSPGDSVNNKTDYFYFAQVSRLATRTPDPAHLATQTYPVSGIYVWRNVQNNITSNAHVQAINLAQILDFNTWKLSVNAQPNAVDVPTENIDLQLRNK